MTFLPPTNKGYTLLFSIIVATLVLSVATFILSISRKQFLLASSSRDSLYALYAADSGLECAVLHYQNHAFSTSTPPSISCNGVSPAVSFQQSPSENSATSTFSIQTGSQSTSCVRVVVGLNVDPDTGKETDIIETYGTNIGWNPSAATCDLPGARRVERALRLIYR